MNKIKSDRQVKQDQLKTDFMTAFLSEHGKRVIKELEKFCFVNTTTAIPNDSHITYFNEGRRSVYLKIQKLLEEGE